MYKKKKKRGQSEESVDDLLDELAARTSVISVETATSTYHSQEHALFRVQLAFANADKEMKRIFGVCV
jgi:hypothetical protein